MNIRFNLLAMLLLTSGSCVIATDPFIYSPKQKAVLLLKSLNGSVWNSTAPQTSIDPIFISQAPINALPGLPAATTFFFLRTPSITNIQELVNPDAFNETLLQPFVEYGHQVTMQQHTLGFQIGQLWCHENLEMGWQWWIGAQERHWWLSNKTRNSYQNALKIYDGQATKSTQTNSHAPQEPTHRLTLWHATSTTVGIGDVHLQARYRMHLNNWISCSVGGYITVPVGTPTNRITALDSDDTLPLETDELAIRIINRARDIMLCSPLGKNRHLGIGLQSDAQLFLTRKLSLRGSFTQIHYLNGIENRYALIPFVGAPQELDEGLPGTSEGISSNNTIASHLKNTLYPCQTKVTIQPGIFRLATSGIHYENIPFHAALSYSYDRTNPEYSESAPLATLRRVTDSNHRINALTGLRKCFDWGQSSTYAHGHYTYSGVHQGAWGFGIGISIQA